MQKTTRSSRAGKLSSAYEKYSPNEIELYWQSKWIKEGVYQVNLSSASKNPTDSGKKPFYNLMMFPYPSAEGLHVGSFFTFGGIDAYGRFKRMQGFDVFEPIGLDGFGIHSENYAMKVGRTPQKHARISEKNFYGQLHMLGNGFDWSRKLETYNPKYYKWTQWLFTELFKTGLAYKAKAKVNYCPSCKTVLSDEQVINKLEFQSEKLKVKDDFVEAKVCERCGSEVERKDLEQWFLRITNYAERLLGNIDKLDWSDRVKTAQRQWIGKKTGINIRYELFHSEGQIKKNKEFIEVFTTRPDTNFGATFIALAPEYKRMSEIINMIESRIIRKEVMDYIQQSKSKSEIERQAVGREKTGVFTGLYAINQLTGYKMPVWVADFVLGGFGTGALVGVPGHDKRDFEFATKFGLKIIRVVVGRDGDKSEINRIEQVQDDEGVMINSGWLDGLDIHEAMIKIMNYMEKKDMGKKEVAYHLRDWLISRQRYWGPPIPMIYCQWCASKGESWFTTGSSGGSSLPTRHDKLDMAGWYPVEEKDLPILLPVIEDFRPMGSGNSPLENHPEFYRTKCPKCKREAKRETDVSDTFLDSSWYFLRYTSTDIDNKAFDIERVKKWLPVESYIGGAEHAVLHLLYSRFITIALHDLGYLDFEEPFKKFRVNGLIVKDGAKMSKSRGNVIVPDEYVKKYGADALRMYLAFIGPFSQGGDFRDTGIEGMFRFLKRVYTLIKKSQKSKVPLYRPAGKSQKLEEDNLRIMHGTIKGVTEDMENLRFNTAIAKLMSWYNFLAKQAELSREEVEVYLKLLAPFAPHITEELWQNDKGENKQGVAGFKSIHLEPWPGFDEKNVGRGEVTLVIMVDGKARDTVRFRAGDVPSAISDLASKNITSQAQEMACELLSRGSEKFRKHIEGKKVEKLVYVPGRVINFVTSHTTRH